MTPRLRPATPAPNPLREAPVAHTVRNHHIQFLGLLPMGGAVRTEATPLLSSCGLFAPEDARQPGGVPR